MINVGDVIVINSTFTNPPKQKFHVCVSVAEGYYFRINSKSHFLCSLEILAYNNSFLDHDSYIECGSLIGYHESVIEDAIQGGPGIIGTISKADIQSLVNYCETLNTLTDNERASIIAALKTALNFDD